jgi:hypothetical protein
MKRNVIDYDKQTLTIISDLIQKNLTPDLIPKKWVERNSTNPTFGHCHNASGCLYRIFGSKNVKLHRALDDEGIYHWWVVDKFGEIIDLTADQYYSTGRTPPYDKGEKAGLLGFDYRKRVDKLYDNVMTEFDKL